MSKVKWVTLVDYEKKYGISVSTLRRRIRQGVLDYVFEKGKYMVEDNDKAFSANPLYTRKDQITQLDHCPTCGGRV